MAVNKNQVALFPIDQKAALEEQLMKFSSSLRQPLSTSKDLEAFKENAHQLYKGLLPSALRTMLNDKQLIIVPDGPLQNIPFEALVSATNSFTYFIQDNEMSYAYSMSFLMHNANIERSAAKDFIAYAPGTFQQNDLPELSYTITEVGAIQDAMNGINRLNLDATKAHFLTQANNFKVLHLATHADAGEFPWIAFQDEILETHELYTMSHQAELVVLSACKSAAGKTASGEGVFSIARGFFYSGANSIVSSLWNVNDKATADIMVDFYKGLKNGERKSEALRTAKINYLQASSLSDASPYYWASFVLIGENNAMPHLEQPFGPIFFIIAFGFLMLFAAIVYFFKKNKKRG
jgi:CHAT domain-containing protein